MALPKIFFGLSVLLVLVDAGRIEGAPQSQLEPQPLQWTIATGDFFGLSKLTKAQNEQVQKVCGQVNQNKLPLKVGNALFPEMGEAPWTVALTTFYAHGKYIIWCSGTIISQRHVLTAAHCMIPKRISSRGAFVAAGTICTGSYGALPKGCKSVNITQTRTFKKAVHQKLNYPKSDFAILEVTEPFEFNSLVKPICFANIHLSKTFNWIDMGFGENEDKEMGVLGAWKVVYDNFYIDSDRFTFIALYRNHPNPGKNRTTPSSCPGDSGGTLQGQPIGSPRYYLLAVLSGSYSTDCSLVGDNYSTAVSIMRYTDWICKMTGLCPANMSTPMRFDFLD